VVVRWRVNDATGSFAMRVLRAVAFNYTFISTRAVRTPASIGVESFPTRQPIEAGDYVGLEAGPQSGVGLSNAGTAGDTAAGWQATPDGHIAAPVAVAGGITFAYNADVEPDADHDGYGDETQDKCPTDASTQDVCPPPPPPAPSPAPATQSAASTPPADRTPAVLSAPVRTARLSRGGSITFLVACSENATGRATGTISVPQRANAVRLAGRNVTLVAGRPTKVTLRLSHTNAALLRTALAKREKLTAIVALSVKDAAGNPSATKLSLKLRR
jgi:hypothetical protein